MQLTLFESLSEHELNLEWYFKEGCMRTWCWQQETQGTGTRQDDKSRNVPVVPGKHEKEDVGSTKVNSTLRIFKISVKA